MVEPEALRHRLRQLVWRDRALGEQAMPGSHAGARAGDGVIHQVAIDEAQLDQGVGEQAAGAATSRRRGDAVPVRGGAEAVCS